MPLMANGTLFSLVYLKQTGGKDVAEVGVVVTTLTTPSIPKLRGTYCTSVSFSFVLAFRLRELQIPSNTPPWSLFPNPSADWYRAARQQIAAFPAAHKARRRCTFLDSVVLVFKIAPPDTSNDRVGMSCCPAKPLPGQGPCRLGCLGPGEMRRAIEHPCG